FNNNTTNPNYPTLKSLKEIYNKIPTKSNNKKNDFYKHQQNHNNKQKIYENETKTDITKQLQY
ncbi:hypothetical protein L9G16_23035, partial [Shewanella sp. A25]|nr:hypothetical protein [Shewanella shenzhenensis]